MGDFALSAVAYLVKPAPGARGGATYANCDGRMASPVRLWGRRDAMETDSSIVNS